MFVAIACNIETNEAYFAQTQAWVASPEAQAAPLAVLEQRVARLWDLREAANDAACEVADHAIRRRYLRLAVGIEEYEALDLLVALAAGY